MSRAIWTVVLWAALIAWGVPATAQSPLDPQAYDLNFTKGVIQFGKGQYREAERYFRAALAANPGDSQASFYLGQTLIRLQRPEAAQGLFQGLLEKNPEDGRGWLGLGTPSIIAASTMRHWGASKPLKNICRQNPWFFIIRASRTIKKEPSICHRLGSCAR